MRKFWRYGKAQAGWGWLLPWAFLWVLFAWLWYRHRLIPHRVEDLYGIFEQFLPLAAAFYLAGLLPLDYAEGVAETHLTYPQWPAWRVLQAGASRGLAWAAVLVTALALARFAYLPSDSAHLLATAAAPALALSGAAAAGGAVTRHQAGGIALPGLWWLLDALLPGNMNRYAFLFRVSMPVDLPVSTEVVTRNLYLVGVALWTVALLLAQRRSWWIRP